MIVGLAGTILPVVPGLWLMWVAALIYGLIEGFGTTGALAMSVITLAALAGAVAGFLVPQAQASASGIPWWGQALAAVSAVVGAFLIPIVGAAVGFVLTIIVLHVVRTRDLRSAVTAAVATVRSMLIASGRQFLAGVVVIVTWVTWVLV